MLTFRIFSNSMMSFFWYAAIKFVIARISGSFLYLQAFKFSWCKENQATRFMQGSSLVLRLGLLSIKRIHFRFHQHIGKDKISNAQKKKQKNICWYVSQSVLKLMYLWTKVRNCLSLNEYKYFRHWILRGLPASS